MAPLDREPVTIFGMVAVLLLASVTPFALPTLGAGGQTLTSDPAPSSDRGAMLTPGPVREAGEATPEATPTNRSTPRPVAAVDCNLSGASAATPASGSLATNVAGRDVSVAIIDPGGFAVDNPAFAGQVVETASFDQEGDLTIRNGGVNRHGTASADLVARTAPGASLYLANFRTAHDFTQAVDWAIRQDVDVLVAPSVFYAKPNDGSAPVSLAVEKAADAGITVVVPTGNVAGRHWEGTYDGGGRVEFSPDDTRMYLRGDDSQVRLWLWWNRSDTGDRDDFRVVLYRETGDGIHRVAASEEYPTGPVGTNQVLTEKIRTNSLLSEPIANGSYFVRIEGPPDVTHRVELVATTHYLAQPTFRGSVVAPATAEGSGVIAVGAGRESTGDPVPSSGRGPTNDGRRGVDVLAPAAPTENVQFAGTSAAASYTGGVVALLQARSPSLSPAETEAILQATAEGDGVSMAAGYGLVNVEAALACAQTVAPDP